jgi:ubiquinone biosynthesis monooxygenase Coq7
LPDTDVRSRAIVAAMQAEEAEHGENALRAGGQPFRWSTRALMRLLSRVMTMTTYRL